jgi:Flp pilus assembly protein TadB
MKTCNNCNKEVSEDNNFCPHCGRSFLSSTNREDATTRSNTLTFDDTKKLFMEMEEEKEKKRLETVAQEKKARELANKKRKERATWWSLGITFVAFLMCLGASLPGAVTAVICFFVLTLCCCSFTMSRGIKKIIND